MTCHGAVRHLAHRLVERVPIMGLALLILAEMGLAPRSFEHAARGSAWRRRFGEAGPGLRMGRNISVYGARRIKLGANVTLYDGVFLDAGSSITIGQNSHVDVYTSIYGHGGVTIGRDCAIAAGVRIYSQSNSHRLSVEVPIVKQPREFARVLIDDDVWIGANAVVLPGVHIGRHSVVAAGAVVTRDVPVASVVGGVPAKVLSERTSRKPRDAPTPHVEGR